MDVAELPARQRLLAALRGDQRLESVKLGLVAQAEAVAKAAESGGFSMKDVKELLEAAPLIMQVLPALRAMLTGQTPTPPNGHGG